MANITWSWRKDYLKDKQPKILQPNHQDFRRVRILLSFLDFIGNFSIGRIPEPADQHLHGIFLWFIGRTLSADSNTVHRLVSSKPATFSSQKSSSLTRVKKRCQQGQEYVANCGKMGFSETFLFFEDYILEKENTHIPNQLLDFSFLK